ncbi:hypothetical protein [Saccharothrix syringae]|uniref:Uncharacterized protein n=1 Tax=Saccharothrix syringae TaxID=103733 RepID=A0A5Q0GZD4_SACSY|nr:hypothetical protein [Saccharothrix syringae]QFZ19387.1 hypothetical protein EKG83_19840 [Saccharothrix syringae]
MSIRTEGAAQPHGGDLVPGWLVEPDRVVVPDPPPGLLDGDLRVEVLLAGLGEGEVERISPAGVNAVRVGGAQLAVLDLESASRYAPNAVMPELVELAAAIAAHGGDVRKAFESAGAPGDVGPRRVGGACTAHNVVNCERCQ